jgi:hypothetical protein
MHVEHAAVTVDDDDDRVLRAGPGFANSSRTLRHAPRMDERCGGAFGFTSLDRVVSRYGTVATGEGGVPMCLSHLAWDP